MEPKAGDDFKHLKKEAIERKLSKRRSKIQEMMMEKRKLLAYHMELEQQQSEQQEESEVPKEEAEQKGRFNLNQCHKKAQRKHRRRCWYCKKHDHILTASTVTNQATLKKIAGNIIKQSNEEKKR